ncbi:MAG TPA: alanine dehydrogenase [Firmicutes bacterium]|nr:alanine dehydrogenase [Bacillota bacterium]
MIIGVPKEIMTGENRIAVTPGAVRVLVSAGHKVLVEKGAGEGSMIADEELSFAGAEIVAGAQELYQRAEMIYKVKEPHPSEYELLREGQLFFAYLHLAASPEVTRVFIEKKVIALAYETVSIDGILPMLVPMSEIAGRMATQIGAHFLEKSNGGKGLLLGGVPGVTPAEVVVLGGGIVGVNAARVAMGMGAKVTVIDINLQKLRHLDGANGGRLVTLYSNPSNIAQAVAKADLLIGAVLIPGGRTPLLCTEEMVKSMQPGAVIIDVAIDQGGCIETMDRTTCHREPTYERYGVLHYAVPNMPGAVPQTSTYALSNATLPFALELAEKGWERIIAERSPLRQGINIIDGRVANRAVARAHSLEYYSLYPTGKKE